MNAVKLRRVGLVTALALLGSFSFAGLVLFLGIYFVAQAATALSGGIVLLLCYLLLVNLKE